LIFLVLVNSLTEQEDTSFFFYAIIPSSIEISFTICQQRNVDFASANFFVSTDRFEFMAVVAEWYILSHQIDHGNNCQERFYWNIKFTTYPDSNLLFLLKYFILERYSVLFFVELPSPLIKLFVKTCHGIILKADRINKLASVQWNLCFFINFINILQRLIVSFVDVVLAVATFYLLPYLIKLIDKIIRTRQRGETFGWCWWYVWTICC